MFLLPVALKHEVQNIARPFADSLTPQGRAVLQHVGAKMMRQLCLLAT